MNRITKYSVTAKPVTGSISLINRSSIIVNMELCLYAFIRRLGDYCVQYWMTPFKNIANGKGPEKNKKDGVGSGDYDYS